MIGLPPTLRVYVAAAPVDLRKSYDGLAQVAREVLEQDPLSGHLLMLPSLPPFLGARFLAPLWSSLVLRAERRRQLNGCDLPPV